LGSFAIVTGESNAEWHSTERGSAGSTATITLADEVDPALPRSVLCFATPSVLVIENQTRVTY
jgi:hypothetical protein